jgi:transposase-like protein
MHDTETKEKFIELRANNWSVRRIAQEFQVDKSTLIRWNRQFGAEIKDRRQLELEALQEELLGSAAERFKALVADYQRYHKELENRNPQHVPQYMLFRMVCRLRDQVERRISPPDFTVPPAPPSMPEEKP